MSTRLIQHLKNKCEADANVAILYAQWEFDQKLVGKALENIGGFYPHFSNHNASHSQQILVNIERVLGEDVDLLSATDAWLILEAAYWHDVGMLVDAKNAKDVHSNPDFNFMIQTIANEKGHDLQKFCQAYVENNWLSAIGTVDHPFDGVEKYRQLIAEWFRRGHDKRVGKLVEDPFKDLGITSPRTELLPNRIYRYLGQICVSHGMSFDILMETLPYKQTGLGTEDCHPRFIGCLLRLGDLFDLDDNRFCPVMAKHVSNMPSVSKHHNNKHLSLREFQLDKRTVKLVAECPDEMSYVETQNWFGWIREEFQNQMSQWNLIVPSLKFGSLPTIEQLEVRMEVKYDKGVKKEKILLNNKPMKFTIDEKNGMELLQGANLYSSDLSIYRELIQNSIDATMLRIWLEEDQEFLKNMNPYNDEFRKILEKYPLEILINDIKDENNKSIGVWQVTIKDNGIGISSDDLKYMQSMAGSKNNINKNKLIKEMPTWMKPSGEFGIGLHSCFLLSKDLPEDYRDIHFVTKSFYANESLDIKMSSPLGGKKGYCFITKKYDFKSKVGTELSFYIKSTGLILDNFFESLKKNNSKLDINIIFEESKRVFLESIYKIFSYSPIFIKNSKKLEFNFNWSNERNVAYNFSLEYNEVSDRFVGFRGQNTKNTFINFPFSIMLDYFGEKANDALEVNRDKWKSSFEKKHKSDVIKLMTEYLNLNHDQDKNIEAKVLNKLVFRDKTNISGWEEYKFKFKDTKLSILDILEYDDVYILTNNNSVVRKVVNYIDDEKVLIINGESYKQLRILFDFLNEVKYVRDNDFKINFYELNECADTEQYDREYIDIMFLTKVESEPFDQIYEYNFDWSEIEINNFVDPAQHENDHIFEIVRSHYNQWWGNSSILIEDKLILKLFPILVISYKNTNVIISPYQIINSNIELMDLSLLSEIVFNNNVDCYISISEIKNEYERLKGILTKKIYEMNVGEKFAL
ncbi:TPA: ATP-binding protein [Acinetobacter baumannii]|nr:ATP-binding protein [Acinetobacter baumannii]